MIRIVEGHFNNFAYCGDMSAVRATVCLPSTISYVDGKFRSKHLMAGVLVAYYYYTNAVYDKISATTTTNATN